MELVKYNIQQKFLYNDITFNRNVSYFINQLFSIAEGKIFLNIENHINLIQADINDSIIECVWN